MSKPITLTEENFELPESVHYTKDEDVVLGIRLFNLTLAKKVMKQILDNQDKAERYDEYTNCCQHSEDEYCIWFHELHIADQKIKELKEKLEKIRIIYSDIVDDETFFQILGGKK